MRVWRTAIFVGLTSTCQPARALAGMPVVTFSDVASMRLEAISFFLVVFLMCAWSVRAIWNGLRRDFSRMPKLGYRHALGITALWSLAFLLVLSMISGARELMTPGAWIKDGLTYKLNEIEKDSSKNANQEIGPERQLALERLRVLLWAHAESHAGTFPESATVDGISEDAWRLPGGSGLHYLYVSGMLRESEASKGRPLVYEPELFGVKRLVLLTNGEIRRLTIEQIQQLLER
jgi:hypothetical protein